MIGGKRTSAAQTYPPALCRAIVDGMALQMQWDNERQFLLANLDTCLEHLDHEKFEQMVPPEEEDDSDNAKLWVQAWDDITGQELDAQKVKKARRLEVDYCKNMQVLEKVPRRVCREKTGRPPLQARWIDHNKGDRYRCRWVAKQFKGQKGRAPVQLYA